MAKQVNILYADDDLDDHVFFKEAFETLKKPNHTVHSVFDGAEVIDYLVKQGKYLNSDKPLPDFIILDLNMPVIDGFGILKEIYSNPKIKKVPVYILSVSDKEHDKKRCLELGCAAFFTKPVNFAKLQKVLEAILKEYSESRTRSAQK